MKEDEQALYNAVDEIFETDSDRAKHVADQKAKLDQLIGATKEVLSTTAGRRFVWWILSRGNLFASSFAGRALDQAYIEGQRTIASEVFSLSLKADPYILQKMVEQKLTLEEE